MEKDTANALAALSDEAITVLDVDDYLVDSGVGLDLLSIKHVEQNRECVRPRERPLLMNTASGRVYSTEVCRHYLPALDTSCDATIMLDCPPVLSMGAWSRKGFSCILTGHSSPIWIQPKEREFVELKVKRNTP